MRVPLALVFGIASLALLLAGCSGVASVDTEVSAWEPYDVVREAMSPCPDGVGNSSQVPWHEIGFGGVDAWYRVLEYADEQIPVLQDPSPGEIRAVAVGAEEPETLNVFVRGGFELVIPWAVDMAPEVHIGVSEDRSRVRTIMVTLPDGSPFFPGGCNEDLLGDRVRENLSDEEYARFVERATSLTGLDLELYVQGLYEQS